MTRTALFVCTGNYYRSRFAELVFQHHARLANLDWHATSAGLRPEGFHLNPGPISMAVIAALDERGIEIDSPHRPPRCALLADFEQAARAIALKEAEHRPLMAARFPSFADRITYWHVDDVDVVPPSEALPLIEQRVLGLIAELAALR